MHAGVEKTPLWPWVIVSVVLSGTGVQVRKCTDTKAEV